MEWYWIVLGVIGGLAGIVGLVAGYQRLKAAKKDWDKHFGRGISK